MTYVNLHIRDGFDDNIRAQNLEDEFYKEFKHGDLYAAENIACQMKNNRLRHRCFHKIIIERLKIARNTQVAKWDKIDQAIQSAVAMDRRGSDWGDYWDIHYHPTCAVIDDLMELAKKSKHDAVQLLLDRGANPNDGVSWAGGSVNFCQGLYVSNGWRTTISYDSDRLTAFMIRRLIYNGAEEQVIVRSLNTRGYKEKELRAVKVACEIKNRKGLMLKELERFIIIEDLVKIVFDYTEITRESTLQECLALDPDVEESSCFCSTESSSCFCTCTIS